MVVLQTEQMSDDFGKMLKGLREERGFSLQKLSLMTGISPSYINRLEKSKRKSPGFTKLVALAEALNVEVWVLAGSSLEWNEGEPLGIKELLFNHTVQHEGITLSSDEKELLLEIIGMILNAEWSFETILSEMQEIGELISELKVQ